MIAFKAISGAIFITLVIGFILHKPGCRSFRLWWNGVGVPLAMLLGIVIALALLR